MRQTSAEVRSLIGLLDNEISLLDALEEENRRAVERAERSSADPLDYAALGYTIHNLYSFFEHYLIRIAETFESNLEQDARHADLVDRMAADIPGVRPRFFDQHDTEPFTELREFRRIFRTGFRPHLRPERVTEAQTVVGDTVSVFRRTHLRFRKELVAMADRLE